jgi:hypothetical protein
VVTVVVAFVASTASSVILSARTTLVAVVVVAVVVDAGSSTASLDGVPGVMVRPETLLDREGDGFWQCAEGASLPSCTDRWHDAEFSSCWAATVSGRL